MLINTYYSQKNCEYATQLKEQNDCSVLAFCIGTNIPYQQAHIMLQKSGRETGCGFYIDETIKVIQANGFDLSIVNSMWHQNGVPYIDSAIEHKLTAGHFIVCCAAHMFAVVDGVIQDGNYLRPYVIHEVYKVNETSH